MKRFKYLIYCLLSLGVLCTAMVNNHRPGFGVKRIVINAGHGGKDVGTCGTSTYEKDVALKVATRTGQFIKNYFRENVEILYTREEDKFIELNDIASHANTNNANLFICIHCNANPNKEIFGAETYIMGLHKTKGNLDVAKRENASILLEDNYQSKYDGFDPNSEEANIIFTMFQNAYLEQSMSFAAKVQDQIKGYAKRRDRGVRQAGFLVLWKTKMPAVLIETGFLSNKEEEKYLASDKGQNQLAYSIFRAFREYKYEQEGKTLTEAEKNEKMPKEWELSTEETKQMDGIDESGSNAGDKENKKEDQVEIKTTTKENTPKKEESATKETKTNSAVKTDTPKLDNTTETVKTEPPKPEIPGKEEPKNVFAEYGLVFKIQLANTDKKIGAKSSKFKGIDEVQEVEVDGGFRYYAGKFKTPEEAYKYLDTLKDKGFKDSFVVAFQNGKRITMSEAKELLQKK